MMYRLNSNLLLFVNISKSLLHPGFVASQRIFITAKRTRYHPDEKNPVRKRNDVEAGIL